MKLIKKSILIIKNQGWKVFLSKVFNKIKYIFSRLSLRIFPFLVIWELSKFKSEDPEEVFDFIWNFHFGTIRPMQIKEEFIELLKIFKDLNPKYILEIGTANGGTLFCFCKLAREDDTIISIDLPKGPFGGGYPEWKIPIYQAFKKPNQKLYLLRRDSHKKETLEEVKNILNTNQLDFLFIDGDHSYQGVKKDFEMYSPLVRKGGFIAFHDIVIHPLETGCEVNMFWKEIKENYRDKKEIIKDLNQNWAGIGIIFNK